jgi:hypothetical protein
MSFAPLTEFVSRNWLFTILIGTIGWLLRQVLALQQEKATLKAEILSFKDTYSDTKSNSLKEIAELKALNLTLQKTIDEKCSDEAILAKYDFNEIGVAIHKQTKRPYCPGCLNASPRREVILSDVGATDDYLRCTVERSSSHIYRKSQQHHFPDYPQIRNPYNRD